MKNSVLRELQRERKIYEYSGSNYFLKPESIKTSNNYYMLTAVGFKRPIINEFKAPYDNYKEYKDGSLHLDLTVRGKKFSVLVDTDTEMISTVEYESDNAPAIIFEKSEEGKLRICMIIDNDNKGRLVIIKHDNSKPWEHVAVCTIYDKDIHHIITWFHPSDIMDNIVPIDYCIVDTNKDEDPMSFVWKNEYLMDTIMADQTYFTDIEVRNQLFLKYIGEGYTHYIFKSPIYVDNGRICLSNMNSISEGETGLIEVMYNEGKDANFNMLYSHMSNKEFAKLFKEEEK